ncbi:glycosyltransferase family 2 protein [Tunturiibacter gelidiferens]|uniref:glycosyltransferase family 2 protein n=1 Tax=Tunturiibacter gelidiferens TaxID=3069689 RepID=UPI003D9BA3A7
MSSVDVIVPCYGYGQFLRECVNSVLSQILDNTRVLIIDDASPDSTPEIGRDLEKIDSRVTFLRHPVNKGHIYTYNEGIEWTAAEYTLLLSADDYLFPGALERASRLLDQHPEVTFTFGNLIQLGDDGINTIPVRPLGVLSQRTEYRALTAPEFIRLSGATNIVGASTAVVRTSVQKKVGGYRPELTHTGDMEMWLRLAAQGSVGFVNAYQAVYRRHCGNMSNSYSHLADLEQRKLALDYFFREVGTQLQHATRTRRRIYRLLASDAVGFASSAFNENDNEALEQLRDFALGTSWEVVMTWPWIKFQCKRAVGLQVWNILQSALGKSRQGGL